MTNKGVKFSGRNTPLTAHILEVAKAVRDAAYAASDSEHSASAHTSTPPNDSPQQIDSTERTTSLPVHVSREKTVSQESTSKNTVSKESTSMHGTAHSDSEHEENPPPFPNDCTSTDGSQTSGGDEGDVGQMDTYALTRELRRLKKVVNAQADIILKLKARLKKLKNFVWLLVKHHRMWVKQQRRSGQKSNKASKSKKKKLRKHSSFTLGRNFEENLNEDDAKPNEEDDQMLNFDDTQVFEDIAQSTAERKLDEVEQVVENKILKLRVKI